MRTQKNQIALAELKFSYQALKKPFPVRNAKVSSKFLQQLWQQTLPNAETDFYVLFVNHNREVFSWYHLPEKGKADVYAAQIAGLAMSSSAYGVIISQCCNVQQIKISSLDRLFVTICFDRCEQASIEIIDYIICSKSSHFSLKENN